MSTNFVNVESTSLALTLIRESWKNPKRVTVTERVFQENPERSIASIYICFCALNFFRKEYSVTVPKFTDNAVFRFISLEPKLVVFTKKPIEIHLFTARVTSGFGIMSRDKYTVRSIILMKYDVMNNGYMEHVLVRTIYHYASEL